MNERLGQIVEELAAAPTDRSLEHLEAEIARGIGIRRARARTAAALAPVRIASIGLALATGVTVGWISAASSPVGPRAAGALAMSADLAPSELLERP